MDRQFDSALAAYADEGRFRSFTAAASALPSSDVDTRQLDRGSPVADRDPHVRLHPYSNSRNLDWIAQNWRNGTRSPNHYAYGGLPEIVPNYQVYSRQQHHGRFNTPLQQSGFSSPTGFGHGGFQGAVANSFPTSFDPSRAPNFEAGPLSANFGAHASAEWIDRAPTTITESEDGNGDEAFIISAGIDTALRLEITEQSAVDLRIGAGFDYYPDGRLGSGDEEGELFDFQVLPNSYASYRFGVGQAEISIYDRFARFRNRAYSYYSLDPLDYADYQDHAIGTNVRLPINDRLTVDGGYEFGQLDSLGEGAELLDRSTHNWFGGITFSPDEEWEIGLQASAARLDYDEPERPDGSSATAGLFANLPLSDYTRASATAGVHRFEFDEISEFDDSESLETSYWSIGLENDLNDRVTHSVRIGSGAAVGVSSNYVETDHASYDISWKVMEGTVLHGGASLQRSTESGGLREEELESLHVYAGVKQELSKHTSVGINYSENSNRSDLTDGDFEQHRLQVYCAVELNEGVELRASYRLWNVDSDTDGSSFRQNAASLGLTIQF